MPSQDNASQDAPKGKEALKAIAERLKRQEAKEVPGAASRQPKSQMLDATPIEEADPEHHYRYVNSAVPQKVKLRQRQGYVAVPEAEAESHGVEARLGNEQLLMRVPREAHEERVAEIKQQGQERLNAHKAEVMRAAESVVRELQDKHGIKVPIERILVDE